MEENADTDPIRILAIEFCAADINTSNEGSWNDCDLGCDRPRIGGPVQTSPPFRERRESIPGEHRVLSPFLQSEPEP
jgi:hypothetical protein